MSSLIVIGPSGVGKGTIIKHLLARNSMFEFTLSFTTRLKREGEIHGKHYLFVNYDQYLKKVSNNEVLQSKQVFNNYYGTSKQSFQGIIQKNKVPVLDIDVEGMKDIVKNLRSPASNVKVEIPYVLCVLPPSLTILKERLQGRKTQSEEVLNKRLSENLTQIEQISKLRGPNIFFTTNYQFQLTVYGIQRWLKSKWLEGINQSETGHQQSHNI